MNATCLWRGHQWETVDEVDVPPINGGTAKNITEETLLKLTQGYKRVHQECTQCGERRVLHEF